MHMLSWRELDKEFQALSGALSSARIDVQWGAAGEHLRIAAYFDVQAKQRFVSLSRLAGEKLRASLPADSEIHQALLAEPDPVLRWWRALWQISPAFEYGPVAFQKSDSRKDGQAIYTGSVKSPAQSSCNLALDLLARYGEPAQTATASADPISKGWWERFTESVSLKPGAFGVSLDLKMLFTRKKT